MNLRCSLLLILSAVAVTLFASGITIAGEIARWDFDQEPLGWEPNSDTELSLEEGQLKVRSKGKDPYLTAKVDGRSGEHRITITAKFKGNTKLQVFWTTESEPGTIEENSVSGELRGSEREARSLKLYFTSESPVTSIRIDPLGQKGDMLIDSIQLSDDPAPIPGLEIVATGPTQAAPGKPNGGTFTATVYPGPKGNIVFNAATIWWADGLSAPPGYVRPSVYASPKGPDQRVGQITRNLLAKMKNRG